LGFSAGGCESLGDRLKTTAQADSPSTQQARQLVIIMHATSNPETIQIRLYGLIPISRRTYAFQLVFSLGLMMALAGGWWLVWGDLRDRLKESMAEVPAWIIPFGNALPWILLTALLLQLLEAWIVWRCFAHWTTRTSPAPPSEAST